MTMDVSKMKENWVTSVKRTRSAHDGRGRFGYSTWAIFYHSAFCVWVAERLPTWTVFIRRRKEIPLLVHFGWFFGLEHREFSQLRAANLFYTLSIVRTKGRFSASWTTALNFILGMSITFFNNKLHVTIVEFEKREHLDRWLDHIMMSSGRTHIDCDDLWANHCWWTPCNHYNLDCRVSTQRLLVARQL